MELEPIGKAIVVAIPVVGVGVHLFAVEQAVAIPVGVEHVALDLWRRVPVPQAIQAVGQHVQVERHWPPGVIHVLWQIRIHTAARADPNQDAFLIVGSGADVGIGFELDVPSGCVQLVFGDDVVAASPRPAAVGTLFGTVLSDRNTPGDAAEISTVHVAIGEVAAVSVAGSLDVSHKLVGDLKVTACDQALLWKHGVKINKVGVLQFGEQLHLVKEFGDALDNRPRETELALGGKKDNDVHQGKDRHEYRADGVEADEEQGDGKDRRDDRVGSSLFAGQVVVGAGAQQAKLDPDDGHRNDGADHAYNPDGEFHEFAPAERLAGRGPACKSQVTALYGPLDALDGRDDRSDGHDDFSDDVGDELDLGLWEAGAEIKKGVALTDDAGSLGQFVLVALVRPRLGLIAADPQPTAGLGQFGRLDQVRGHGRAVGPVELVEHFLVRLARGRKRLAIKGDEARLSHEPDGVEQVECSFQIVLGQFWIVGVQRLQRSRQVVVPLLHRLQRLFERQGFPSAAPIFVTAALQTALGSHLDGRQVDVEIDVRLELAQVVHAVEADVLLGGEHQRGGAFGGIVLVVQEAENARRHVGHPLVHVAVGGGGQVYGDVTCWDAPRFYDVGVVVAKAFLDGLQVGALVVQKGGAQTKQQVKDALVVVRKVRRAQNGALEIPALGDLQTGDAEYLPDVGLDELGIVQGVVVIDACLHHPDQLGVFPTNVVQFLRAIHHLGVKGHYASPIADGHQRRVHLIIVAVLERRDAILCDQRLPGYFVGDDLEHREQTQVLGRVVQVLDLAALVVGPVERGGGVPQVILILWLQLDFDVLVAVKATALGGQFEFVRVIGVRKGRQIQIVRHVVAVIVRVPDVRRAIAVRVPIVHALQVGGVSLWGWPFGKICQAIRVRVRFEGVAGPCPAVKLKPVDFQGVGDHVPVAVPVEGVGAQAVLGDVVQAIVVGILAGGAVAALVCWGRPGGGGACCVCG